MYTSTGMIRSTPCIVEYESNGPPVEAQAPIEITHFGSGIWSYTRRTTGPIFKVTVPAMMIRSLCLGLGRNTPAPNRSISKRPAPVAIISIAQQAKPKVIGHNADLRAQLTTGAPRSITLDAMLRRTKFVIESTVVKTKPSLCSDIRHFRFSIANCQLVVCASLDCRGG